MPFLSKMFNFWKNLFRRRQVEADLNDELQTWVEEMAERKIQAGFAPETARGAALLELGGIDRIKDLVREQRIGFRSLRTAGVTAVVAVVAFVSGASAAIGFLHWHAPLPSVPSAAIPERVAPAPLPVLKGRLVNNAGEPIPFVEIGIKQFPIRRFTHTDESGNFEFTNPPQDVYGLEAGTEYWSINEGADVSFRHSQPNISFEFLGPSNVSVKDKNGQPAEGERIELSFSANGTHYPPESKERRRFHYDSSIIELRSDNLSPGKLAWR